MKQIPITELTPGMVTAQDILSYDNKTIVPKNVVLTENIIARLEGYSIYYAQIEDKVVEDLSTPMANQSGYLMESSISRLHSASHTKSGKEKQKKAGSLNAFPTTLHSAPSIIRTTLQSHYTATSRSVQTSY